MAPCRGRLGREVLGLQCVSHGLAIFRSSHAGDQRANAASSFALVIVPASTWIIGILDEAGNRDGTGGMFI